MAVLPFIRHLCICVPTVTDKDLSMTGLQQFVGSIECFDLFYKIAQNTLSFPRALTVD